MENNPQWITTDPNIFYSFTLHPSWNSSSTMRKLFFLLE
jgi:hypothetical protein